MLNPASPSREASNPGGVVGALTHDMYQNPVPFKKNTASLCDSCPEYII